MKELEKLIMALYKNNHNLLRFSSPVKKAPATHCIGAWVGPRTGLDVVEKRNILPLPVIQPQLSTPYARRDAADTAAIRMECTPLHIYFSLDLSLQLLHLCVPAPTNLTLLQFGLY
jgi:hypothetical protein